MQKILISGVAATLLLTTTACDPATIGLAAAGMALDAMTGSTEAAANQAPNLMEALSGLDDQVSESCLAKIDQLESDQNAESKEVEISTRVDGTDAVSNPAAEGSDAQTTPADGTADMPVVREATTSVNLSSQSEKVCRLQPVCLPGNSFPIEMMMCSDEPTVVADAGSDDASAPDVDTTPKEVTWAWSEEEKVENPAP